jgi:hypothetical protein
MTLNNAISTALKRRLQLSDLQIVSIERLNSKNLNNKALGDSFAEMKYDVKSNKMIGFTPVRVYYASNHQTGYFDLVVKGHDPGAFVDNIIPESFRNCHININIPYQTTYIYEEFKYLFEGEYHYYKLAQPYLGNSALIPNYYGRYYNREESRNYIFIELLQNIKHINQWQLADRWAEGLYTAVINGLAKLHAPFYGAENNNQYEAYWLNNKLTTEAFVHSNPLWYAMLDKVSDLFPTLVSEDTKKLCLNVISSANDWHKNIDSHPKTIIHGDFNPRNFGFTYQNNQYQLLALDWECIRWGIPQYDLAQFLLHSCSEETIIERTEKYILEYWQVLQSEINMPIDKQQWLNGFDAAVKSHLVNRATLLTIIGYTYWPSLECFGQRMFKNAVKILTSDRLNFME